MGWLAAMAAMGAYGVLLDHLGGGSGNAISTSCLRKHEPSHEAVAMTLTGVALALMIPAALRRR